MSFYSAKKKIKNIQKKTITLNISEEENNSIYVS